MIVLSSYLRKKKNLFILGLFVYGYWRVKYQTQCYSSFPIHVYFCHFCVVVVKRQDMKIFKPLIYAARTLQRTKQP